MVQEQCCPPQASGSGLTFTLKWALLFPGSHVSWILLPPYPSHCSKLLLGRKQENPRTLCNSCHGCKGVNWDHLNWLHRPPSNAISSQGSCEWLLQGQPQSHGCRGMTCWQLRKISHLRLHHKSDGNLLNQMLKHKVTLNSYEFVTLGITPGGLAVLLHLLRTHRLDFSWFCVTHPHSHSHHCFTLHLSNSATG